MKVRDGVLERIADALEAKYGVQPYIDVSGVIESQTKRIANAITAGLGTTTKTLSNGTELNELIRIAEALETEYKVDRLIQVGNTTDEALDRIAHALEEGSGLERAKSHALNRIARALEARYGVNPIVDKFGVVHDDLTRIADVMESEGFVYDAPVELVVDFGNNTFEVGDQIDYSKASISVVRASGRVTQLNNTDVSWLPASTYTMPHFGTQLITATYEEEEN